MTGWLACNVAQLQEIVRAQRRFYFRTPAAPLAAQQASPCSVQPQFSSFLCSRLRPYDFR